LRIVHARLTLACKNAGGGNKVVNHHMNRYEARETHFLTEIGHLNWALDRWPNTNTDQQAQSHRLKPVIRLMTAPIRMGQESPGEHFCRVVIRPNTLSSKQAKVWRIRFGGHSSAVGRKHKPRQSRS